MSDKYLELNIPGRVIEVTAEEAQELGAIEEVALSEADAWDSVTPDDQEASRG